MANTASAKKRVRANVKRTFRNRSVKSAVKTGVTKVRRTIAEGGEGVAELVKDAISSLDRAAVKGVLHRNNAARRKSRLMRGMATAATAVATPTATKTKKKTARRG